MISTPYLAWLSVCLIWGTTYLGIRVALESIPPALVGGLRWPLAATLVMGLLVLRGERLPPPSTWPRQALLGFLLIGLGNGAVVFAERSVPSGIAAVVIGTAPFWMSAFEAMLPGGERVTRRIVAGLAVGFSGLLLLVWPDLTVGGVSGRQFAVGLLLLQVACIGWSLGSSYSRRGSADQNPLAASALQMMFGGLMMLVLATARGEWAQLVFTPRALWAEIYLIVVGSLAGYSAYIYALQHLPISTVALYAYINPIIAVLLGALLLGEDFGPRVIVASVIVLAGVAVVRTKAQGPELKAQGSTLSSTR